MVMLSITGVALLIAAALFALRIPLAPWIFVVVALGLLAMVAIHAHTTLRGKFAVWTGILSDLGLKGNERVLDIGCGRGTVLMAAAKLVPAGRAVGIDIWSTSDQSGNSAQATERNAKEEGVADRVEVRSGDMRDLPFPESSFDVVVSSMAIHNVHEREGRTSALDEAIRVLRRGGTLAIVDFMVVAEYAEHLRSRGMQDVELRKLDWRFWYGSPWLGASLVRARRA
jgi:ubiquinone/menaquinone biosynthesis C-methylase UbiE